MSERVAVAGVLLARGFRPFFLLGSLQGVVLPLLWLGMWSGWLPPPAWLTPVGWHAHEMIFGFAAAAIAGFLLTSVPVWSDTPAVTGRRLAGLVALWLVGRVAMGLGGWLPSGLVAAADLPFLLVLALAIGLPILRSGGRRNLGFPLVLLALSGGNLLIHLQAAGVASGRADLGIRLSVYGVTLLIVVIGGRIVPSFTGNALRRAGVEPRVRAWPWIERGVVPMLLLFDVLDLAGARMASAVAGLVAATLLAARAVGWLDVRSFDEPLVWSLHLGYGWVPIGVLALALGTLGAPIPRSAGLHALTAGAMGTMILAVTSRVALGHTGRPLVAPRPIAFAYGMVTTGALLRIVGPLLWPAHALGLLQLAGLLWSGAFALFLCVYAPILVSPRADGRPG